MPSRISPPIPSGSITIEIDQPTAVVANPSLSGAEKSAAWAGTVMQQALVSGVAWGFVNKLPVAAGAAIGGAVGGPPGTFVGTAVGQLVGGAMLGPAHYVAEALCFKARVAIGSGWQYSPDTNSAKDGGFRQNAFMSTFASGNMAKAVAKPAIVGLAGGLVPDKVTEIAVDVAFSCLNGAVAQTITSLRKNWVGGEQAYKTVPPPSLAYGEPLKRGIAGLGVAVVNIGFDVIDNDAAAVGPAAKMLRAGARAAVVLDVWFRARDGISHLPLSTPCAHASGQAAGAEPDELAEVISIGALSEESDFGTTRF